MKNRKVTCVLVICVMLGILVGESQAKFNKQCYLGCFMKCVGTPGKKVLSCATSCVAHCILHGLSSGIPGEDISNVNSNASKPQAHSFCKLGCSVFSCANVSTPNKPDGDKVANCVDSCGKTCAADYSP